MTHLLVLADGILAVYATPNLVSATVASKLVIGLWTLFAGELYCFEAVQICHSLLKHRVQLLQLDSPD